MTPGDATTQSDAELRRALEERLRFERLGGTKTLQVDVRLIAASNRELAQAVAAGIFRADLYEP
ncbi:MAG: hypothetical protein H6Q86_572 [candidate division NC10 bacterium]|jgi:transcriptional regulator with GAF, ATPase, and Fis domain|nr:hypothetical protein [candidate division NC10 bacterium]